MLKRWVRCCSIAEYDLNFRHFLASERNEEQHLDPVSIQGADKVRGHVGGCQGLLLWLGTKLQEVERWHQAADVEAFSCPVHVTGSGCLNIHDALRHYYLCSIPVVIYSSALTAFSRCSFVSWSDVMTSCRSFNKHENRRSYRMFCFRRCGFALLSFSLEAAWQ